ncbi:hypothetical protein [Malacoplasma iowae]|uniref:Uncharacterized protein n=2 Tax=Malacoplasma iowae TaxID=2116 RepID=A0A084U2Z1_MALIO|nr:hypothetical protein [Malacoplasma iowae]VEU63383.1 Uncharacterised protein [Mycoplasmopsis fermentans]EGZ31554.1 hypothetical protein GUU_01502 [Malacoplasma iowae 695]KFB07327.1 hypothetical protein P271_159 [Malacoplasma iowae DK-CPA]QHG89653.1 hypothetical protein EER00_01935 [Malacoplasma iowae 695]WPL35560.1 hypothetical protein QX180_04510 [Malacoplasma iowae]
MKENKNNNLGNAPRANQNNDYDNQNETVNKDVNNYSDISDDHVSSEANNTFFEKFEKTKKDFLKEKREKDFLAKRSLSSKSKAKGFDNKLRDDKFVKDSWISFIVIGLFLFAYACVVMGFLATQFNGSTSHKWAYIDLNLAMNQTTIIFSGIIVCLIPIPYIYLLASWFVGINSVHRSKSFFLVNMSFIGIAILLFICVLPMSSVIFAGVNNFSPIA